MRILTNDGETFAGPDAIAIVRAMRDAQWSAPALKRDYMSEVAERVAMLMGAAIDTTHGAQAFLDDLRRVGLITIDVDAHAMT